jgi:hypothetical protein
VCCGIWRSDTPWPPFPASSNINKQQRQWFSGKIHRCHVQHSMGPAFDSRLTHIFCWSPCASFCFQPVLRNEKKLWNILKISTSPVRHSWAAGSFVLLRIHCWLVQGQVSLMAGSLDFFQRAQDQTELWTRDARRELQLT